MVATEFLPRSIDEGRLLQGKLPGDNEPSIHEAGLLVHLEDISQFRIKAHQ